MTQSAIRLAITGPTGAGKSRFCARLVSRGAALVDADRVGHGILRQSPIVSRLRDRFGAEILAADGQIDRRCLGRLVFADPQARADLDDLVHGPLAAACARHVAAAVAVGWPLVILEAAVYFLLPGPPPVDMTVTVTAPESTRLERLIGRGLTDDQARSRITAQAHLEQHWQRAHRLIANTGTEDELEHAADRLWCEFVPAHTPTEG